MAFKVDEDKCTNCQRCNVCPVDAISYDGYKARIDKEKCIECGSCKDRCDNGAIS